MMDPAAQMSALVDARDAIELRDKALMLDYVSRASSEELLPLDVAQLRLNQAEYEAGLAEERLATTKAALEQRGDELRKTRQVRLKAKRSLDREIANLNEHADGLRLPRPRSRDCSPGAASARASWSAASVSACLATAPSPAAGATAGAACTRASTSAAGAGTPCGPGGRARSPSPAGRAATATWS